MKFLILIYFFNVISTKFPTNEIIQDYKCRANRIADLSETFDSHITWVLTQDCLLFLKLDWQMKYFIKKGLDFSKVGNNKCYMVMETHKIYVNVQKKHIYIIRFYYTHTPSIKLQAVVNRVNFIKVLHRNTMEYVKIKYSATDTYEDYDYMKIWSVSTDNSSLPLDCAILDKDSIELKCLFEKNNTLVFLSYVLNSKKSFEFDETTSLYHIKYDPSSKYSLHLNDNKFYVIIEHYYMKNFITVKPVDKEMDESEQNNVQRFMIIPNIIRDNMVSILTSKINNVGVILHQCYSHYLDSMLICKVYFIQEGYFSRKSVCVFNSFFTNNSFAMSGFIPLKNHRRTSTTLFRKDECINEIENLIKNGTSVKYLNDKKN